MPADLGLALLKLGGGQWLPDAGDLILDAIREAVVEVVPKGTFSVSSDLRSNPIELNDILRNVLTILHGEVVKLVLGISDRIMWPEVSLELEDKLSEIIHPQGMVSRVLHKEVRFEPLKGHALQVRLHEGDFCAVGTESLGMVLFALH